MLLLRRAERFASHNVFGRYAHVIADGRGSCNEHFDSRFVLNMENPKSEQKLSRSTFTNYEFPKFSFKYSLEDVAQHRASFGTNEAAERMSRDSQIVQVPPPSFALVFSNFILLSLKNSKCAFTDRSMHVEQIIDIIRPLEAEGIITYDFKVVDVIDKGNATVYTCNLYGRDENGNELFFLQKKCYEINLAAVHKKKTRQTVDVAPIKKQFDQVFEFTTPPFNHKRFLNPTPDDMTESVFSPNHWRQYHDIAPHFTTEPICHGRMTLGAAANQILNHFANGDATLLKRIQTRFTHAVYAADTLVTKARQVKERVHFETFAKESGKLVLQGYLDLQCGE